MVTRRDRAVEVVCQVVVAATTPLPVLNVMNSRGSWMKFTPALKSWPRPPMPGNVPREVVAELPLLLLGRLRCVGALPDGNAVGERVERIGAVVRRCDC